jgi:hypothetical protein
MKKLFLQLMLLFSLFSFGQNNWLYYFEKEILKKQKLSFEELLENVPQNAVLLEL